MAIKLAVFDMAGTTVYDNDNVADAFRKAFYKFHFDTSPVNINHLMGYKKTQAIETVLDQINVAYDSSLINDIHEEFMRLMLQHYESADDIRSLPFAEEIFDGLREENIRIGLNTGFSRNIADVIIKRLGWEKLIDDYISSNEVEEGRPSPLMIYELMRRNGIRNSSEVLKVGDTEVDINEGRNAGCGLVIAVTTGAYSREELFRYQPDFIVDGLSELLPIIDDFE